MLRAARGYGAGSEDSRGRVRGEGSFDPRMPDRDVFLKQERHVPQVPKHALVYRERGRG